MNYRIKQQGSVHIFFFVLLLLLASLACQTLLGDSDSDSEVATEQIEAVQVIVPDEPETGEAEVPDDSEAADETIVSDEPDDETGSEEEAAGEDDNDQSAPNGSESDDTDVDTADQDSTGTEATVEPADQPADVDDQESRSLADAEPLALGQIGFIQDPESGEVAYALHLENPNPDFGIQDSEYTVALFDDQGTVLETDFGFIHLVLPSEQTALAGSIWLDDGLVASEIEIQLSSGDPVVPESMPALSLDTIRYFSDDYSEWGTAVLQSSYDAYLEDIIVSFVTYDEAGNISGSGYTYADWIYPQDSIGVEVYLATNGDVADIRAFPRISFFSQDPSYGTIPGDATALELVEADHVVVDDLLVYGLQVSNANQNYAIENSRYSVTAYATEGSVIFAQTGYLDLIPPGGTAVGGSLEFLESAPELDYLDFQIRAGDYIQSDPLPAITAENPAYIADDFSPTVTGQVNNPFEWELEDLKVWAVLRDADGVYIGGGYSYVPFVPANGSAAVEIYVDGLPDPATVELIPALSYYDETLPPE